MNATTNSARNDNAAAVRPLRRAARLPVVPSAARTTPIVTCHTSARNRGESESRSRSMCSPRTIASSMSDAIHSATAPNARRATRSFAPHARRDAGARPRLRNHRRMSLLLALTLSLAAPARDRASAAARADRRRSRVCVNPAALQRDRDRSDGAGRRQRDAAVRGRAARRRGRRLRVEARRRARSERAGARRGDQTLWDVALQNLDRKLRRPAAGWAARDAAFSSPPPHRGRPR